MRKITTTLFKYQELSDAAQLVALNRHRTINLEFDWYAPLEEAFKMELEQQRGFSVDKIYWDDFDNPHGGVVFTGELSDITVFLKNIDSHVVKMIKDKRLVILCTISHKGNANDPRRHSELLFRNNLSAYNLPNIEKEIDKIENEIIYAYYKECDRLFEQLREEHDQQISDEYIIDTFNESEAEFYASGERYYEEMVPTVKI